MLTPRLAAPFVLVFSLLWLSCHRETSRSGQAPPERPLRIGFAVEAPYAYLDEQGQPTGESPAVARAVLARLGHPPVEWRLVDFGQLIAELEAGRIDVIASGLFITPERAQRVRFSLPTFQVGAGLLVRAGNPSQIFAYEDLLRERVKVAVLEGSFEASSLAKLGVPSARLLLVPDARTGWSSVLAGEADALALSGPTVTWIANHEAAGLTEAVLLDASQASSAMPMVQRGGFAFRRSDQARAALWDRELAAFLGTPEHLALLAPYGFSERSLPPRGVRGTAQNQTQK